MRLVTVAVLALTTLPLLASQRPAPIPAPPPGPAPTSQTRAREVQVVIDGCVENRRLKIARSTATNPHESALQATEYLLEGPKELLAQLSSDHKGHHEEIVGIAILPPLPDGATVDTRTKTIGGARVSGAVRQAGASGGANRPAVVSTPGPVRIKVQSARHIADSCSPAT